MPMIRPAGPGDIPALERFLTAHLSPNLERHRRILNCKWMAEPPNIGFVIEDNTEVKGFLGALYARRPIGGSDRLFCNMTGWTVAPEYRPHSLALMKALMAQPDLTITNFSASETVAKILRLYRFKQLDTGRTLLSTPLIAMRMGLAPRWRISFGQDALSRMSDADRQLAEHHMSWSCVPVHLEDVTCARSLIVQRRRDAGRMVAEVLYSSDWTEPETWQPTVAWVALKHFGAWWLGLDARRAMPAGLARRRPKDSFYHSAADLAPEQIDRLFTETVPRDGV